MLLTDAAVAALAAAPGGGAAARLRSLDLSEVEGLTDAAAPTLASFKEKKKRFQVRAREP